MILYWTYNEGSTSISFVCLLYEKLKKIKRIYNQVLFFLWISLSFFFLIVYLCLLCSTFNKYPFYSSTNNNNRFDKATSLISLPLSLSLKSTIKQIYFVLFPLKQTTKARRTTSNNQNVEVIGGEQAVRTHCSESTLLELLGNRPQPQILQQPPSQRRPTRANPHTQ